MLFILSYDKLSLTSHIELIQQKKEYVMEQKRRIYPVGVQDFASVRNRKFTYIDKTQYIVKLMESESTYVFLSRPRRFGKSLFVSTLKSYFEGRKELFEGLAIAEYEKEWTEYPVLHFDFSDIKEVDREGLIRNLNYKLCDYEKIYGVEQKDIDPNRRLGVLIKSAYEKTGEKVVVLFDEYDSPLIETMHDRDYLDQLRTEMKNFYSPLKLSNPYLRFVFITGITKFSQVSIFSALNNIRNISMLDEYAGICGITNEELHTQMDVDVEAFAERKKISTSEMYEELKTNYDGYHFSPYSPDIYNPYSLLNAFQDKLLKDYWFNTGTPTFLIKMLDKFGVVPSEIGGWFFEKDFDMPTETMHSATPLLYQSGYITIKSYDPETDRYFLDMPNKEVRKGLIENLLPNYVDNPNAAENMIVEAKVAFRHDDMDKALGYLKEYFLKLPQTKNIKCSEGHYQQMLYSMFLLMDGSPRLEVDTAGGRINLSLKSKTTCYIIELKINKTAQAALDQINENNYAAFYANEGLKIVKIGISFDTTKGTIEEWVVER